MAKSPTPTSTMRYDPAVLGKGETMLSRWPELVLYTPFEKYGAAENDCWLRFVALYCDSGSDYRDLPLVDKKAQCFAKAGVPEADPRRVAVARWEDAGVVAMAKEYVRILNSLDYALLFHGTESAWQTIEGLSDRIVKGDMDETKFQTAQKTRKDNMDAMFAQVPDLVKLRNRLFMDDEQLGAAALQAATQNTPTAERRAEGRSFIPPAKK
ncbi:MAG: hypothetical protein ACRYFX_18835 [Janthinobacterium lividum]